MIPDRWRYDDTLRVSANQRTSFCINFETILLRIWMSYFTYGTFSLKIKMTTKVTKMFKVDPLRLFEYSSWLPVRVYLPYFSITQYFPSLSGIITWIITWHSSYVRFFKKLPANNYFMLKCYEKIDKMISDMMKKVRQPGFKNFLDRFCRRLRPKRVLCHIFRRSKT